MNFKVHFTVKSHALNRITCLPRKEYRLIPAKALAKCHSELQPLLAGQEYCSKEHTHVLTSLVDSSVVFVWMCCSWWADCAPDFLWLSGISLSPLCLSAAGVAGDCSGWDKVLPLHQKTGWCGIEPAKGGEEGRDTFSCHFHLACQCENVILPK